MTFLIAIRAFLGKLPWQVWLGVAAIGIVLLAYSKGYGDARDKYRRQMAELTASVEAAQEQARAAQVAVNEQAEQRYETLAKEADHNAEIYQSAAMDAARRFIAANRVRPNAAGSANGSPAPAQGDSTSGGNGQGGNPELVGDFVIVPADDIRICTVNTARLMATREWALGLAGE